MTVLKPLSCMSWPRRLNDGGWLCVADLESDDPVPAAAGQAGGGEAAESSSWRRHAGHQAERAGASPGPHGSLQGTLRLSLQRAGASGAASVAVLLE